MSPLHTPGTKRRLVTATMSLYSRLGTRWVDGFQDAWLGLQTYQTPDAELFFRARHYDLVSRRDLAMAAYHRLLGEYPHSVYAEDGLYFMARLLSDERRWSEAVETYDLLLGRFGEQGTWANVARRFKGLALENDGRGDSKFRNSCGQLPGDDWIRFCVW